MPDPIKVPEVQIVDLDHDRHQCRVCGNRAEIPGAVLCQHCWGLTVQFEGLWARAPKVAAQWLMAMVKHKGVKIDGGISG
ncbi:MAG TPA: hypothetical protein VM537_34400 [Anaerolineae bacterium]|nr:hypothetical protein [Anaerolineae bacterium]